jgi:hypothetical protein
MNKEEFWSVYSQQDEVGRRKMMVNDLYEALHEVKES